MTRTRIEGGVLANEEVQDKRRKRVKSADEAEGADLREVARTPAGRRMLARFIRQAGMANVIDATAYNPDVNSEVYAQGRRSMGAYVIARMRTHCLGSYRLMEDEAAKRAVPDEEKPDA